MTHGRAVALAAAAGVGTADLGYAALAVFAAGAVAGPIDAARGPAALVGALVLGVLAVRGLRTPLAADATEEAARPAASPLLTYAVFVGLTVINPATVLTFTALAVGIQDRLVDTPARLVFVLAVGVASLVWQVGLALVGSALGAVPRPGLRRATRLVGAGVLLVLAGLLARDGLRLVTS